MKARPKPKKISFIKLTKNQNKIENKTSNQNKNKVKKSIRVLNNDLLLINSPRNNDSLLEVSEKFRQKYLPKIQASQFFSLIGILLRED